MNEILQTTSGDRLMDIDARVRRFITTNFYVAEPDALDARASLLDEGIVDSTGVLELIGFLESEFGITVADAEITPENFDSISRIASFVQQKKR